MSKKLEYVILIVILLLGGVLRFYDLYTIPYTHDEFSALFRTSFKNLPELFDKGIKVDGHPAGVQLFLYAIVHTIGSQSWVLKTPFILMGIASIYLVYLIGKRTFNSTVALITSAYMATLQYPIMYSQIARPYISGMFLSLLMVYFWQKVIENDKHYWKNASLFVLFASFNTYNHHFSLLFTVIVGLSGLLFVRNKAFIKYLFLGLAIVLLYIPHLSIFFFQLGVGGVESWLSKPESSFLYEYFKYIFQYCFISFLIVLISISIGLKRYKNNKLNYKYLTLFFVWFILPFLIGYYYSITYSAVLQYSSLIFGFPFLLLFIFGWISPKNKWITIGLIIVIVSTNTYALIYKRQHYKVLYNSAYIHFLTDLETVIKKDPNTSVLIHSHPKISAYYISNLGIRHHYNWIDSMPSNGELILFLRNESQKNNQLYLGALSSISSNIIPLIQDYFPELSFRNNYFGGETYLFRKNLNQYADFVTVFPNNNYINDWQNFEQSNLFCNESKLYCYQLDSLKEWSPGYTVSLDSLHLEPNCFIDIAVDIERSDSVFEGLLVASLDNSDKNEYWASASAKDFSENIIDTSYFRVHLSLKMSDIRLSKNQIFFKTFIWNQKKQEVRYLNYKISIRKGNPIVYGLYEDIK